MQSKHPFVLFHDPLIALPARHRTVRISAGGHDTSTGLPVPPASALPGRARAVQQVMRDLAALQVKAWRRAPPLFLG